MAVDGNPHSKQRGVRAGLDVLDVLTSKVARYFGLVVKITGGRREKGGESKSQQGQGTVPLLAPAAGEWATTGDCWDLHQTRTGTNTSRRCATAGDVPGNGFGPSGAGEAKG